MRHYTEDEYAYIMDRLNNGRQLVQCARVLPDKCQDLIDEARRMLTACAKAIEAGAKDDMEDDGK